MFWRAPGNMSRPLPRIHYSITYQSLTQELHAFLLPVNRSSILQFVVSPRDALEHSPDWFAVFDGYVQETSRHLGISKHSASPKLHLV